MHHPSPVTRVVPSRPSALRRAIPAALILCACAGLSGEPKLAAQSLPAASASGLTLKIAKPNKGIEGMVTDSGVSIVFESRKTNRVLTATIARADGTVLYEYRDFNDQPTWIRANDGTRIKLSRSPELRINGVVYGASTPEQLAALRSLAASPEGKLIRRLGLELVGAAPNPRLVDERRGLELAVQALWPHFEPGGPAAPPLTADYEVGSRGYVVLAQPEHLVLATNHTGAGLSSMESWQKHDDSAVNDCFGRCGSGCTGGILGTNPWPSHWTDTYGAKFPYQQEIRCVSGEDWVYTWYATPTTHSVDGWWTPGCQLHDNCCHTNALLCYTVCNVLLPVTGADLLLDPQGEVRNWTYTDYAWDIRQDYVGYSGCTCPGVSPYAEDYECVQ